jgi:hypothetical protein
VAVLPLGERDTDVMLDGVAHWRPLVNGDSGFVPRPYARALELLSAAPSEEGMRLLRALGVTHVVSAAPLNLPPEASFGADRVFALSAGETAREVAPGQPVATLWTAGGALIDLGSPRTVSRVIYTVSDGPWVDRPQVQASLDGKSFDTVEARASLADATLSLYRDPRQGRGEVLFEPRAARHLRLGPRVPARKGALEVGE